MSEPIRILHVVGIMNLGGTENMIMNLYRRVDKSKVQFDFVENSDQPAAFDEEILATGGRIYRCPHYNGKNHIAYKQWWKRFFNEHKGEYAAVHGHLGSTASIYLSVAKKQGIYTIAHSHSTGMGLMYRLFSYSTRFIADAFFACSDEAAVSRYGKRVAHDTSRCTVLKNAIDSERFRFNPEMRASMRRSLKIDNDALVIGHIGQFRAEKNHAFLLRVFEEIHMVNANARLLLVGDGVLRATIKKDIADRQLQDSVILAGAKQNTQDYYQAMDRFVFPSVFEGLGIAVIEAQTSGLPCLVSDAVPDEVAVTKGLVSFRSIGEDAKVWADEVLGHLYEDRTDRTDEVRTAGYDIAASAQWLEEFYLNIPSPSDKANT